MVPRAFLFFRALQVFHRPLSTRSQPPRLSSPGNPGGTAGASPQSRGRSGSGQSQCPSIQCSQPSPPGNGGQAHVPRPDGHAWGCTKYQESAIVIVSSILRGGARTQKTRRISGAPNRLHIWKDYYLGWTGFKNPAKGSASPHLWPGQNFVNKDIEGRLETLKEAQSCRRGSRRVGWQIKGTEQEGGCGVH